MAQGRMGVGVALLFALAGPAAAQPQFPALAPYQPPAQPFVPPGAQPFVPPGAGGARGIELTAFADAAPPMKELEPGKLGDIHPPPDKHGGGHGHGHGAHEIDGFMEPFVPHHGGWYAGAEFLLVRPRQTDFDYLVRSSTPGLAINGPIDSLRYDLGTGVRVEGGYRFASGKWETVFAYTYVNGNGDATATAGAGTVLFPTLTRPGLTDRALSATTTADLDYNTFDMMIARRAAVDEHFAIRWLGGFRFTDIKQTFNTLYDGADARRASVTTRSRFAAFGPMVGAEAVLVGWNGFHFYGRASGGLITGRSTNSLLETNDTGGTTYINTRYDVSKVVPTGTIGIGGGWQYKSLAIRAGYEVTHWQGIFERPRFVDDVSPGKVVTRPANLTLEGLFIQVGLSY
ncbi:MAG: hypothetical protein FJ304_23555 [Planctomycetes bacterium]|nr:hypothetical protein [Planctomycetota bacterium]